MRNASTLIACALWPWLAPGRGFGFGRVAMRKDREGIWTGKFGSGGGGFRYGPPHLLFSLFKFFIFSIIFDPRPANPSHVYATQATLGPPDPRMSTRPRPLPALLSILPAPSGPYRFFQPPPKASRSPVEAPFPANPTLPSPPAPIARLSRSYRAPIATLAFYRDPYRALPLPAALLKAKPRPPQASVRLQNPLQTHVPHSLARLVATKFFAFNICHAIFMPLTLSI
jgi:hypothetical protein